MYVRMHVGGERGGTSKGEDCVCVYVAPITKNGREEEGKRWVEKGRGDRREEEEVREGIALYLRFLS